MSRRLDLSFWQLLASECKMHEMCFLFSYFGSLHCFSLSVFSAVLSRKANSKLDQKHPEFCSGPMSDKISIQQTKNCVYFCLYFSRSGSRWSGGGGGTCTSGEESAVELSRAQADADELQSLDEWLVRSKEPRIRVGVSNCCGRENSRCKLDSLSRVVKAKSLLQGNNTGCPKKLN